MNGLSGQNGDGAARQAVARLYNHFSAGDFLDIDDASGACTPVPADCEEVAGALAIAHRHGDPIAGSYTIEDGHLYALYWADGETLVLRTPDGRRHALFKRVDERRFVCLAAGLHASITPSAAHGYSDFRLLGQGGTVLHACSYNALRYQYAMGMNFSAVDEDLSDWDFFVALQEGIDALAKMC